MLGLTNKKKKSEMTGIVIKAKSNRDTREKLIIQYTPFINKTASQISGKYITDENDEHSIGLIAFNEAIDYYDADKGVAFLTFASSVIKKRIIDFYRKEHRRKKEISIELINEVDGREIIDEIDDKMQLKEEIHSYVELLKEYGIELKDLIESSPKNNRGRQNAMNAVSILISNEIMKQYLIRRKSLPLQQLEKFCNISRKTLERQRKYIIAVTIIHIYKIESLMPFVPFKDRKYDP